MNKVERKEIKRELVFVFIESYRYVVEWYRLLFVESYHVELRFELLRGIILNSRQSSGVKLYRSYILYSAMTM